jgi:hypothetical protein
LVLDEGPFDVGADDHEFGVRCHDAVEFGEGGGDGVPVEVFEGVSDVHLVEGGVGEWQVEQIGSQVELSLG